MTVKMIAISRQVAEHLVELLEREDPFYANNLEFSYELRQAFSMNEMEADLREIVEDYRAV